MTNLSEKRKFLVGHSSPEMRKSLIESIQKHIALSSISESKDGTDVLNRLSNDWSNIVIVEKDLPRIDARAIFERILKNPTSKENKIAFIFIGEIPEDVSFVEEVVSGQLQYVADARDDTKLSEAFARALNFLTHETVSEFYLRFLASKEVLLQDGAKADHVYILRRGELRAFRVEDKTEITLGTIKVGEFVGEMAYINGEPRSASVIAETDCELIEIPINELDVLLLKNPTWSRALMKTLSGRLKNSNLKFKN